MGTLCLKRVTIPSAPDHEFHVISEPTITQQKVFEAMDVDLKKYCR
ncbi:MAG: hypothetical protein OXE77_10965 [Flavobacteriaceae bacterium]|nr:hypothetical protein [Flavobacteriaceae bacterium]MCY4298970.1 hypothetical protein [Flavobacteriaceae bacterium]